MAIPAERSALLLDPRSLAAPLQLENTPQFIWAAHAASWELIPLKNKLTLLPSFKVILLQPGINGVKAPGENERLAPAHYERVISRAIRDGWLPLAPDAPIPAAFVPPNAGPGAGYRRCTQGQTPTGKATLHYHDAWTTFRVMSNGIARPVRHQELYNLWRQHILTLPGLLPDPDPDTLQQLLDQVRDAVGRAHGNAMLPDAIRKQRLKALEDQIAAIQAVSAPKAEADKPTPTKASA